MIFSNSLLVFSISLQFGSYDMMINNTLQAFSGHIQVQHDGYLDDQVVKTGRFQARQHRHLGTGFDLKYPHGICLLDHAIGCRILGRDIGQGRYL